MRDACCAGVDCASDGYPTVCFVSGGRYGAGSICEQAVLEGALQTCPLLFLNDSRLQGLYSVRTASLIAAPPAATADCDGRIGGRTAPVRTRRAWLKQDGRGAKPTTASGKRRGAEPTQSERPSSQAAWLSSLHFEGAARYRPPPPPPPRPVPHPAPAPPGGKKNWSDKMVNLSNEALVAGVSVLAVLGISWLVILCTRKSRLRKAAGREQRRQRINTSSYDAAAAERWASSSTAPLVPPPAT